MEAQLLLVDDDPYTRKLFAELLRKPGIELRTAADLDEARRLFEAIDFNLVILDQRLPDGNGLDFFTEMRRERPQQIAILITGYADVRDAMSAVRKGLFDYLTKPFENLDELEAVIGRALRMDAAVREVAAMRDSVGKEAAGSILIGNSAALRKLDSQVRQVAPLDTSVLIEGESGSGKEIFAHRIHAFSKRAQAKFFEVNCGALSEALLEATLFGYEKGAFTGAAKTTAGYFEVADGGTLFLDEISDMTPKVQASLLRVLQEHSFARLGSTALQRSDFRLVCATNKPLEREVADGRFRADLYYRINVVSLRVPPLRERRTDILPLAAFFLDRFNSRFGKQIGPLSPDAAALLESAPWPGNVRELSHAIERAVAMKADGPLVADDLTSCIGSSQVIAPGERSALLPFREARERFERDYFASLLRATEGNVSEAARKSGIARQNLYQRIKRFALGAP